MELGCDSALDIVKNETFADLEKKECDVEESGSGLASSKAAKNGGSKETAHSLLNSVNKSASQIRKPPHRRSASPLNWFPRKKIDSFLKRKIRLLQEVGGMNSSLDETLGDANPHYSRIAREKIAARQAANKAMEARKAAMVEASWCRILRAARIQSKEAEDELEKAEECVAEAFKAAAAMGVMMYDRPDCPRRPCEIETSSVTGGASTHTVTASFETAFEVDKEVAAALKKAFILLANCPSSLNKEEFRDLLRKISQNPDIDETDQESSEISSECESDPGSELEPELHAAGFRSSDISKKPDTGMKQRKCKNRQLPTNSNNKSLKSFTELVDMMLDRLKGLQEDELASLAIIVATCGLNAALLEMENGKNQNPTDSTLGPPVILPRSLSSSSSGVGTRRYSSVSSFMDGQIKRKEPVTELPSLDKFLVKHVTRLEREVQEAKNLKKSSAVVESGKTLEASHVQIQENRLVRSTSTAVSSDAIPDLGSILVKHVSRLERDIRAAKNYEKNNPMLENGRTTKPSDVQVSESGQGNSSFNPAKQFSHQSKEIEETKLEKLCEKECKQSRDLQQDGLAGDLGQPSPELDEAVPSTCSDGKQVDKENIDLNKLTSSLSDEEVLGGISDGFEKVKVGEAPTERLEGALTAKHMSRIERAKLEAMEAFSFPDGRGKNETSEQIGLDKILIKPVHRLEREKMQALEGGWGHVVVTHRGQKNRGTEAAAAAESLHKVLVKHVSRLEKEKMAFHAMEGAVTVKRKDQQFEKCGEGLDEILVKHQSRLEKAKLAGVRQPSDHIKHADSRREARERELQEAWGGLSLGNSIRPHLSRLERDKAAWMRAEEEERRRAREL